MAKYSKRTHKRKSGPRGGVSKLATRVRKIENQVQAQADRGYLTTAYTGNEMDDSATFYCLNDIAAGDGPGNRTGNVITIRSVRMKMEVYRNLDTYLDVMRVRMWIIRWNQNEAATPSRS